MNDNIPDLKIERIADALILLTQVTDGNEDRVVKIAFN